MNKSKTLRVEKQSDFASEWEIKETRHGTKYTIHRDYPYVGDVQIKIHISIDRLNLIERYCDLTGSWFDTFVSEAIYEKMDREVREPNIEKVKRNINQTLLKKWDNSYERRPSLQDNGASY